VHYSIVLAIFVPKIIKVNGNLTKFWRKQFWLFFETRCKGLSWKFKPKLWELQKLWTHYIRTVLRCNSL